MIPIANPAFPPEDIPPDKEAAAVAVDEGVIVEMDRAAVCEDETEDERRVDEETATAMDVGRVDEGCADDDEATSITALLVADGT